MGRLPTKQCAAWRCRREQYLRESGRHVDLIREGYAAADEATNWTVVVGGRGRGPLISGQDCSWSSQASIIGHDAKKAVHRQRAARVPRCRGRGRNA